MQSLLEFVSVLDEFLLLHGAVLAGLLLVGLTARQRRRAGRRRQARPTRPMLELPDSAFQSALPGR